MNKKKTRIVRCMSVLISFLIVLNTFVQGNAYASSTEVELYNKPIAKGIYYVEKQICDSGNLKKRMNIITADLSNNDVNIIFSKAKDKAEKSDTLSQQIQREIIKGNNVVAGINADMFDMGSGFSTGPQIKNGAIITGFNSTSEENIYPVFGIDRDRNTFIQNIHMDAELTAEGDTVKINNINRTSYKDSIILNTSDINEYGRVDFSNYASNGALTTIRGVNGPVKLGQVYEGTVEDVGIGKKSIEIPDNCVVLASNGAKMDWIKSHIKQGDKISFKVDFDRKNIVEAVGTYAYLVKDGKDLNNEEMIGNGAASAHVYARKARSAIGITKDNRVIAITVDSGVSGISNGITFREMADYLFKMGAVDAAALDGGGSTQMNVRLYGNTYLNVVNTPSDGRERSITNGILFTSGSIKTYEAGGIEVSSDINIYKGSSYQFSLKGTDTNLNPANLSNMQAEWGVSGGVGSINSSGWFTAGQNEASGLVTAKFKNASGSADVNVTDSLAALNFTDSGTVGADTGGKKQFYITARDVGGQPVIITNNSAAFKVTGGIGTIDKNGLFTALKKGTGTITANAGGASASIRVVVGSDSTIIDNFEHNDINRYNVDGFVGGTCSISKDAAKSGTYSLKVSYDYDKSWTRKYNGTINIKPTYEDKNGNNIENNYVSYLRPKKIGMWVYGNGYAPWLRAVITDGNSETRTIDMASKIDWNGWKYVEGDVPSDAALPVTLKYFYMVECDKSQHLKGSVYFDDISFIYNDTVDRTGPVFSNFKPSGAVHGTGAAISLMISDVKSGVDRNTVSAKLDGKSIPVSFNAQTGMLTYNASKLSAGNHVFEAMAGDLAGNAANPSFKKTFTVNLDADNNGPVVSNIEPLNDSTVKTATPRISFNIEDDNSGVNPSTVTVLLDGSRINSYYDATSGYGYAVPAAPIADGIHTVEVYAKDNASNTSAIQNASFTVNQLPGPKNPNNFTVSFVSDTHNDDYASYVFKNISRDESELVINVGDGVDTDSSSEWNEFSGDLSSLNKPYMLTPGNHEAFSGNLNNYTERFGSGTYSFEYGNALFISLNSAIGGSISSSDPTQFAYLNNLLQKTSKQNIFIYTHVPAKDCYSTGHVMTSSDVSKLDAILATYKKNNPSRNINVISGDVHAISCYTLHGVNYYTTGNGSDKRYVNTNYGSFLSYTKFNISGTRVTREVVPLADRISIVDTVNDMSGCIKIAEGTVRQLYLYGDFTYLSQDYIVRLNMFKDLDVKWTSDNPDAISVDSDGYITAKKTGSAVISASLSGKTASMKVESAGQNSITPAGIKLKSAVLSFTPGQSSKLALTAFDLYGNSFTVDNDNITWNVDRALGSISNGVFTAAQIGDKEKTGVIEAQFGALKTSITIKITTAAKKYVTVTASTLSVRDCASINGKVLGKLTNGTKVEAIGEINGWIKINYNGREGYISEIYTKDAR